MSVVADGPVQPSVEGEGRVGSGAPEPSAGLVQPSLRRMRRFGVRPDRDLGQNFLIDSNILAVIGRAAELERRDVVLEIGGGLGVLSEYLAVHARHVHVVEIDERLREALADATDPHANVTVHWADAMVLDLRKLDPEPEKVVANLPYGIAAGVLLRSIEELPSVYTWVAMVQREVGERLAARPVGGGRAGLYKGAYGLPSVLAQLACEVEVVRAIPRTVFQPVPNVDSVLVRMRRRGTVEGVSPASMGDAPAGDALARTGEGGGAAAEPPGVSPALRALVAGAFAHRRKTLAGSLALAQAAGAEGHTQGRSRDQVRSRERVRDALTRLGHPADARAERLAPEDFRALARLLEL